LRAQFEKGGTGLWPVVSRVSRETVLRVIHTSNAIQRVLQIRFYLIPVRAELKVFFMPSPESNYYIVISDTERGPYSFGLICSLWHARKVNPTTHYRQEEMERSAPLSEIADILNSCDAKPFTELYYVSVEGKEGGPYTIEQLRQMWEQGILTANTLFWSEFSSERLRLLDFFAAEKTAGDVNMSVPLTYKGEASQRILPALLLCLFLGALGAHRFYSGWSGFGIGQALLFFGGLIALDLGGGMLLFACGMWVLADFYKIVTGQFENSDGQRIKQWV
jgi:TM2 domain-containing membrane protein YozV